MKSRPPNGDAGGIHRQMLGDACFVATVYPRAHRDAQWLRTLRQNLLKAQDTLGRLLVSHPATAPS